MVEVAVLEQRVERSAPRVELEQRGRADRLAASDRAAAAALRVDHLEARRAVRVARRKHDLLGGGIVGDPEASHRSAMEQAELAVLLRQVAEETGAVADLEHVVQRVVRAARDVAEARVEGASAAAAGAPERRARHHAAAVVVGLRGLPAVELAAALRALHRLLHERRLHGAQAALRIGAGELAFGDEPGRQRVLPSGGLPHSRIT